MEPIQTLYERDPAPIETVTAPLATLYSGGLAFPLPRDGRPYVIANFVSTLDGVISYDLTGQRGGGPISGESEADHAIMGLLRASADAVIFGARSSARIAATSAHQPSSIPRSRRSTPSYAHVRRSRHCRSTSSSAAVARSI